MPVILIVGTEQIGSLECSYAQAFQALGWDIHWWDPGKALRRVVRGGLLGQLLSSHVEVGSWIRKANRELVLLASRLRPDLVLTFTHDVLRAGALAQIRVATNAALVNIWPDTLVNLGTHAASCAAIYDLIATYSRATVPAFENLGARRVSWVPLAGDPLLHPVVNCAEGEQCRLGADVTFIGGWRREREELLSRMRVSDLKIWGPDWGRCRGNPVVMRAWQGRSLRGIDFAKAVASSKVNLNIIDGTNYPAANMRFFELLTAGGMQVCSSCPEMQEEFRHGEHLFYYADAQDLDNLICSLLADPQTRIRVAKQGQALALERHTYEHRARHILEQLGRA